MPAPLRMGMTATPCNLAWEVGVHGPSMHTLPSGGDPYRISREENVVLRCSCFRRRHRQSVATLGSPWSATRTPSTMPNRSGTKRRAVCDPDVRSPVAAAAGLLGLVARVCGDSDTGLRMPWRSESAAMLRWRDTIPWTCFAGMEVSTTSSSTLLHSAGARLWVWQGH